MLLDMMSTIDILARGRARRRLRSTPSYARLVRQRAGLTQTELAQVLGVDRSAVSRWESGRRLPRPEVLQRYADVLARIEAADR